MSIFISAVLTRKIDKINGILVSGSEIKTLYEGEDDTNAYTDIEKTKLAGVAENATITPTGSEIKTLYEGEDNTNAYTDIEKTKLAGVAENATIAQPAVRLRHYMKAKTTPTHTRTQKKLN